MVDGVDYIEELDPGVWSEQDDTDESDNWQDVWTPQVWTPDVTTESEVPEVMSFLDIDEDDEQTMLPMATTFAKGIPLFRTIKLGCKGIDVIASKRALARAGFMEWGQFNSLAGENWMRAVKAFQKRKGLDPSGWYGSRTHVAMTKTRRKGHPKQWAYDAVAIDLLQDYNRAHSITPDQKVRHAMVDAARFWIAHNSSIDYAQIRPFPLVKPPVVFRRSDCSGFVSVCAYAAGAKNPNVYGGRRMSFARDGGQGYTGTLMAGGVRCQRSQLKLGDLIFYGYTRWRSPAFNIGDPTHVAIVIDLAPLSVGTLGSSRDPSARYFLYRGDVNHYRTYDVTI